MLRIDPKSGRFWIGEVRAPLVPRMSYAELQGHPAFPLLREILARRASDHREHWLPEGEFEGCRVWGSASITNDELESLWLQLLTEESDGALFRYERDDPRLLALQERWLREVVGVESREYPWGLVWNRYNINAGWHDIAIIFAARAR